MRTALFALVWGCLLFSSALVRADGGAEVSQESSLSYKHPGIPGRVTLANSENGTLVYVIEGDCGPGRYSPEEFAQHLLQTQARPPWLFRLLNISSLAGVLWVGLGLAGQVLFALRMIVQWLCSEKERRSVVPVAFWWMSLGGASLLLVYFIWRRDVVGILGQATGWAIYLRNLALIYRKAA
jgi:lipid-A-disaccharide synthase-like uncharacterized protein